MDIYKLLDQINSRKYEVRNLSLLKKAYPRTYSGLTKLTEAEEKERVAAIKKVREQRKKLEQKFKEDALSAVGLIGHPKADQAYGIAWDNGHADGLREVLIELEVLADLLIGE